MTRPPLIAKPPKPMPPPPSGNAGWLFRQKMDDGSYTWPNEDLAIIAVDKTEYPAMRETAKAELERRASENA